MGSGATRRAFPVRAPRLLLHLYPDIRSPDARLEWADRSGAPRGVVDLPVGDWKLSNLSPDQTKALATSGGDLWQVDLGRGVPTRLMKDIDVFQLAQWSPDGRRIAATAHDGGREVLRLIHSGGSGPRDSVRGVPGLFLEAQGWSADGRSLLVATLGSSTAGAENANSWDLFVAPLDGGQAQPYLATTAFERRAKISPDGRWVAYVAINDGESELVIDSYPVASHRTQILSGSKNRYITCMWGRQGRELIYNENRTLVSLPLEISGDVIRPGKPSKLFELDPAIDNITTVDGERFLMSRTDEAAPGPAMRLVLNWTGLLKK